MKALKLRRHVAGVGKATPRAGVETPLKRGHAHPGVEDQLAA